MMEFFENFGVEIEASDMSFSVSLNKGQGYEWGNRNSFSSLFAQKKNILNPRFLQMIREIVKFKDDVIKYVLPILLPLTQKKNIFFFNLKSMSRGFVSWIPITKGC